MFEPRCPNKRCRAKLKSELEVGGGHYLCGYFIERTLRHFGCHTREPYWCCTNPKCRFCFNPSHPFWFKQTTLGTVVPKSFIARELGILPPHPKPKRPTLREIKDIFKR